MASRFGCFQPPRVTAPVNVQGVIGDRVLTVVQPSKDAAQGFLSDDATLCAAFDQLRREGEYLEVASKSEGSVTFRARRLSTGEEWTQALERKKVAAEAAALAHKAQVEQLLQDVHLIKAAQKKAEGALEERMAAQEKKSEEKMAALAARMAEERRERQKLEEKVEENGVRVRILASTGEAIALRLMCDLSSSLVKEAAFTQWAPKDKQVSRGLQQMSSKPDTQAQAKSPSSSSPSEQTPSGSASTMQEQAPTVDTRLARPKKKDSTLDAFTSWLEGQKAEVEVVLPEVGRKRLSQQALTTVAKAPLLSQIISGACSPDGAHSAPLVAIAYVLASKETAGRYPSMAEHLEGLKELFAAFFNKQPEEVLADYKAQRNLVTCEQVVHLDTAVRKAKQVAVPVAPADSLASLGLRVGKVLELISPSEPSARKAAMMVSIGGGTSKTAAVPAGPLPFQKGDLVLVAVGVGRKALKGFARNMVADAVIFASFREKVVENIGLEGATVGESLIMAGSSAGVAVTSTFNWEPVAKKVTAQDGQLRFDGFLLTTERTQLSVVVSGDVEPLTYRSSLRKLGTTS